MPRIVLITILASGLAAGESAPAVGDIPPGGANAPAPTAAPAMAIPCSERVVGSWKVRLPWAPAWKAPEGGVPEYRVPGPLAGVQGPDGHWRGHGYLETQARLIGFACRSEDMAGGDWRVVLDYAFEEGASYQAILSSQGSRLRLEETSALGNRDVYVFDCFYDWQPTAGLVLGANGNHAGLYLPCHYDRPEAAIEQFGLAGREAQPMGLAVFNPQARDVLALWGIQGEAWQQADRMGIRLWQRRQIGNDYASRHVLGPETKSDGTPNPHTAKMIGTSRYEGHVTLELALGRGKRLSAWTMLTRPADLQTLPTLWKEAVHAPAR